MAINSDILLIGNDMYIDPYVGDFDIMPSDEQHIQDTCAAFPGWWKQNPADGIGISGYSNSSGQMQQLATNTKQQLQSDGYQASPIVTQNPDGKLTLNPNVQ